MLKPLRYDFLIGALIDVNSMDVLREVFEQFIIGRMEQEYGWRASKECS